MQDNPSGQSTDFLELTTGIVAAYVAKNSVQAGDLPDQNGQETPITAREDGGRFVLVEGLHRLEACRSLGEDTIVAISSRHDGTEPH